MTFPYPYGGTSLGKIYPVLQEVTQSASSSNNGTISVSMPSTVASGDKLLMLVARRFSVGTSQTFSATGWTNLTNGAQSGGTSGNRLWIDCLERDADGTEGGTTVTLTSTLNTNQVHNINVLRFKKHKPATPIVVSGSPSKTTSGTPNAPSLSPGGVHTYQYYAWYIVESSINTFTSYPANCPDNQMTNVAVAGTSTGTRQAIASANDNSGTFDPGTYSTGSIVHICTTFATQGQSDS